MYMGPTTSKPGPMLLRQASIAEKFVVIEKPSSDSSTKLNDAISTYAARYALVFSSTFSSTVWPLIRMLCTF